MRFRGVPDDLVELAQFATAGADFDILIGNFLDEFLDIEVLPFVKFLLDCYILLFLLDLHLKLGNLLLKLDDLLSHIFYHLL